MIAVARIVSNARRLGHSAFVASVALDLVAPIAGRSWHALCCWCAMDADPTESAPAHRISTTAASAGGCSRCPYTGCDTLVIALAVAP